MTQYGTSGKIGSPGSHASAPAEGLVARAAAMIQNDTFVCEDKKSGFVGVPRNATFVDGGDEITAGRKDLRSPPDLGDNGSQPLTVGETPINPSSNGA